MARFVSARLLTAFVLVAAFAPAAQAQLTVPVYNSRPGAPYALYLNFAGFSFTGVWGGTAAPSGTPGVTPAYDIDSNTSAFSAGELNNIKNVWSRVSEKYAGFNINVTTVDPAPAGSTDFQRQAYYDSTAKLMHTVIGGGGAWIGGGGYSWIGTAQNAYSTSGAANNGGAGSGWKTNFAFAALAPTNLVFVGELTAHENGHGLSLWHQSDYTGATLVNQYSSGSSAFAPIMGNSYSATRGLWRQGSANINGTQGTQNDPAILLSNTGIGSFINDGIGHTRPTATPLPLTGSAINSASALGVIVPASSASPNPIGEVNYQDDFFLFATAGGSVTVNLISGRSTITAGTADPGATLDGSLQILDSAGAVLSTAATSALGESITTTLTAGQYYIRVYSAGGKSFAGGTGGAFGTQNYYDMGSYFLTGTGFVPIPEPGLLLAAGGLALLWRIRRRAA